MKIVVFLLFCTLSVFAHKLNLFLEDKENSLYLYSYYASGSPCKNCKVEFYDENNKIKKTVKTDIKGEYLLENKNDIKYVKVEALGGHAVSKEIKGFKKSVKKEENTHITSLLAVFLLALIFIGLKRIKR